METARIEAFVRAACSVLDFDIGEIWSAKKILDPSDISLKFVQLYSSPAFEDFHSLLLPTSPLTTSNYGSKHQISPIICREVCDARKIVWINSSQKDGVFTGWSDAPFNTAVGVPLYSIGNDLHILVLFAVARVTMNSTRAKYLIDVIRGVSSTSGGFLSGALCVAALPTSTECRPWEFGTLIDKYAKNDKLELQSMANLSKTFDTNVVLLFSELFRKYISARKDSFTEKQMAVLRATKKQTPKLDQVEDGASSVFKSIATSMMALSEVACSVGLQPTSPEDAEAGVYHAPDSSSLSTHVTYRLRQSRFHEFMIAVIGMTVFDGAELWLRRESSGDLHLVTAVHRTATMKKWVASGVDLRLPTGIDVPGKTVSNNSFCWDGQYALKIKTELATTSDSPRAAVAKELRIQNALGVPVPGQGGPCGALVFYSTHPTQNLDPVLIQLLESAMGLLTSSNQKDVKFVEGDAKFFTWLRTALDALAPSEKTSAATEQSIAFDQKLQLCRANMARLKADLLRVIHASSEKDALQSLAALASTSNGSSMGVKATVSPIPKPRTWICTQNYCHSPSSSDDDLTEEQVLAIGRGMSLPPKATTTVTAASVASASKVVSHVASVAPTTTVTTKGTATTAASTAPAAVSEDLYSDAVVSAARALANFGNFQWGTFLEGSGIEENTEGYQSIKLGSDKILDYAYSADTSRKRKYDRSVGRGNGAGAAGATADGVELAVCLVDGCESFVENPESQYCSTHRGTRRCQKDGCGKCAQGATKYCIAHGGGRRCTYPGCFKGARDKLFCAAHGGGKRCTFEGCTKSAVGGSLLCTAHGGGKRCKFEGCNKSSQSSTDFCVKHGGGRSCMFKGCNKVARGKTDFCAAHGGGVRCKAKGCYKIAVGATSLCRMHSTAQAAAASAVAPEHANLGSEALKLAVQSAGGVSDDEDDEDDMTEHQLLFATGK